jgi:hypothetical protein
MSSPQSLQGSTATLRGSAASRPPTDCPFSSRGPQFHVLAKTWNGQRTSRGVGYLLEGLGLPKTEIVFRRIGEDVLTLRDSGLMPWETVADGSRRILRHGRFDDAEHALAWLAETYERVLWKDALVQAQVWVGKAGIAEILAEHAHLLGLDVLPTRGFSGAGFIRLAVAEPQEGQRARKRPRLRRRR